MTREGSKAPSRACARTPLVLRVGEDTIRVDTWGVCGDDTRRHLSEGDQITVFGELDVITYDASEILDARGEPACP